MVAALLAAFARDDVEAVYALAAPKLRRQTVDAARFATVVRNARYAPLWQHARAEVRELHRLGSSARQAVTVYSAVGAVPYLFALVWDEANGWLLSGISREDALE